MKIDIIISNQSFISYTIAETLKNADYDISIIQLNNDLQRKEKNISKLLLLQKKIESKLFKGLPIKENLLETRKQNRQNIDLIINLTNLSTQEILNQLNINIPCIEIRYRQENLFKNINTLGILEPINNENTICLEVVKEYFGVTSLLYKAHYNWFWSFYRNQTDIFSQLWILILKSLKETEKPYKSSSLKPTPKFTDKAKYLSNFYSKIASSIINKINYKLFHKKSNCWSLFFDNGIITKKNIENISSFKMPNDQFWADPFLFSKNNETFVFFENYDYQTKRGIISCGKIENDQLTNIQDIVIRPYHLSYPFLIEEDNQLYMIPEASEGKKIEILKCIEFPTKWETHKVLFEGEEIVDSSFYKDKNNILWLFINKGGLDMSSSLYIYKLDSLECNEIIPHKQNPIYIDSRIARNAGPIFSQKDKLYRPSQNNSRGIYGYALNINEIEELTLNSFKETKVNIISPNFNKKIQGIHHLHQLENKFIFDASFISRKN